MSTDALEDEVASLDGTLVPLDIVRAYYAVSPKTLQRWMRADNVKSHGHGPATCVAWTDLPAPSTDTTRWHRKQQ